MKEEIHYLKYFTSHQLYGKNVIIYHNVFEALQ